MKKLFFTFLSLIIMIFANICHAQNFDRCLFNVKPKIIFKTSLGKLRYDFSKNAKEISELAGKSVIGLARTKYGSFMSIKYKHVRHGNGFCTTPETIEIYVGIAQPVIYVTNSVEEGECFYNFILRHEQAHMQTSIRMLEQFVTVAPKMFAEQIKKIKPPYIKDQAGADAATLYLHTEYSKILTMMVDKLDEEKDKEQEKIDDPSLDNLVFEVCTDYYENTSKESYKLTLEGKQ